MKYEYRQPDCIPVETQVELDRIKRTASADGEIPVSRLIEWAAALEERLWLANKRAASAQQKVPKFFYKERVYLNNGDGTKQHCIFLGQDMFGCSSLKTRGGRIKYVDSALVHSHDRKEPIS